MPCATAAAAALQRMSWSGVNPSRVTAPSASSQARTTSSRLSPAAPKSVRPQMIFMSASLVASTASQDVTKSAWAVSTLRVSGT